MEGGRGREESDLGHDEDRSHGSAGLVFDRRRRGPDLQWPRLPVAFGAQTVDASGNGGGEPGEGRSAFAGNAPGAGRSVLIDEVAAGTIDDMIVDGQGRAYVGDLGLDTRRRVSVIHSPCGTRPISREPAVSTARRARRRRGFS